MRNRYGLLAFVIAFLALSAMLAGPAVGDEPRLSYPKTKTVDQVDDYHGTKVSDPYRWLEDLDSKDTAAWVRAQNEVTFGYLEKIQSRERIESRLTSLWNFEKFGIPMREGGRYFYSRNDGLQNHSVIYTAKLLADAPRALIDPNTFTEDGTRALSGYSITDDGRYAAYGVSDGGSDWQTYRIRDIETGKDLSDVVEWIKFSGASWSKDGKGFFYSRYDAPKGNKLEEQNHFQKVYYHQVGTPQSEDKLVYHRPDQKDWGFGAGVTDDGRYLLLHVWKGTEQKNRVFYRDLQEGDGQKVVELLNDFDADYTFIDNDGPVFWFFTDLDAPRGRVIAIDTTKPDRKNWKEIIPEASETLVSCSMVNNTFIASYLKDAYTQVKMYDVTGKHVRDVALPGIGTAGGFGGKRHETETFYSFTSFATPPTIYRYDMKTGQSTIFKQPKVGFNPDDYETQQIFYSSKDGARIPMFITHKKGLKRDGNNPALLYGYGGFNSSNTPNFSVSNLVWMEMGGIYALANIRGGGEYGKAWHDAGKLQNKQNCFDDFIAAGEWLVSNKFTQPKKLAILGGSNGGLLVGACITQRPDLFGAAIPVVGVLDMLRFQNFTIGWAWVSDYGDSKNPEDFKTQYKYSPLHNIKKGTKYPATLIVTGDHDDRVVPSHSFKFASALQAAHAGEAPVIIRVETRAGHGAGKPTKMQIEEAADRWAFLVKNLGMDEAKIKG